MCRSGGPRNESDGVHWLTSCPRHPVHRNFVGVVHRSPVERVHSSKRFLAHPADIQHWGCTTCGRGVRGRSPRCSKPGRPPSFDRKRAAPSSHQQLSWEQHPRSQNAVPVGIVVSSIRRRDAGHSVAAHEVRATSRQRGRYCEPLAGRELEHSRPGWPRDVRRCRRLVGRG